MQASSRIVIEHAFFSIFNYSSWGFNAIVLLAGRQIVRLRFDLTYSHSTARSSENIPGISCTNHLIRR